MGLSSTEGLRGRTDPMQLVTLLVQHPCPFSGSATASSRGVRVTHLCHRGTDAMLEVHAPDSADLEPILRSYRAAGGAVVFREPDAPAALIRFAACVCCQQGRVIPTVESAGNFYLPPSSYSLEGEKYQFLVPDGELDDTVLARLPREVHLIRVGTRPLTSLGFEDTFLVPVSNFFSALTPRQSQALILAFMRGYYRIPHSVTTAQLARTMEVSREAFDALLRKGQNKLLAALFPYLATHSPPLPDRGDAPSQGHVQDPRADRAEERTGKPRRSLTVNS